MAKPHTRYCHFCGDDASVKLRNPREQGITSIAHATCANPKCKRTWLRRHYPEDTSPEDATFHALVPI